MFGGLGFVCWSVGLLALFMVVGLVLMVLAGLIRATHWNADDRLFLGIDVSRIGLLAGGSLSAIGLVGLLLLPTERCL